MRDPKRLRQLFRELVFVVSPILPEHGASQTFLLNVIRFDRHGAWVLIGNRKQRLPVGGFHRQPRHLRLFVPVLGKAFLRIVQQLADDIVVFHIGIFGQIIAKRFEQAQFLRPEVGLRHRIVLRVRFAPVDTRFNGALRHAPIETNSEVHLLRLQPGGQIVIHHKIDAVLVCGSHRWPGAGVIQIRVKILSTVRHVVGHQVDVIEQGGNGFHIHPAFRTFRIRAHRNRDQLFLTKRVTHLF